MDAIDLMLLEALMVDGRASWADLSERVGMSAPAVAERVRRLEDRGIISGYAALVDGGAIGARLTAFVSVALADPSARARFLETVESTVEIQECHHVAGEDDYLLKIRCGGTADLERLLSDVIKGIPGVARTRTTVVLSTSKDSAIVPLPEARA